MTVAVFSEGLGHSVGADEAGESAADSAADRAAGAQVVNKRPARAKAVARPPTRRGRRDGKRCVGMEASVLTPVAVRWFIAVLRPLVLSCPPSLRAVAQRLHRRTTDPLT